MPYHHVTPLFACSFGMDHDEYQERFDQLSMQDYRLLQVVGHSSTEGHRFAAIWARDQSGALQVARHGLSHSEYQSLFDELTARGCRLTCVSGYPTSAGVRYAAIWRDGSWSGYRARHGRTSSEYQDDFDDLDKQDYRLLWVNGCLDGSHSSYAGIWSKYANPLYQARHRIRSEDYQEEFDELAAQGYRIKVVNAHKEEGVTRFAGLWVREDGVPKARHNMSASTFDEEAKGLARADWQPTCISGYEEGSSDRFAAIWEKNSREWCVQGTGHKTLAAFDLAVRTFMEDRGVPGGGLAIVRNGRLVLARGYSLITEHETPVTPLSLFRIASVSKPITGVAIVKLIEDGELSMTDTLSDLLDMYSPSDSRVLSINVAHLLYHVAGWEAKSTLDPTAKDKEISEDLSIPLPITRESIIRWMSNKTLRDSPGQWYEYSNYGYLLLGQIIESVTGVPYEDYVRANILAPLGIRRMRVGRTLLEDRLRDEVTYHSAFVSLYENIMKPGAPRDAIRQYGGSRNLTNNAAHGGWVASPVDLARFVTAFDDPNTCPILSRGSVNLLFQEHAFHGGSVPSYYACGWEVDRQNSSDTFFDARHTGTFKGSRAALAHWDDGQDKTNIAFVLNRDVEASCKMSWDLVDTIRAAADSITKWPLQNLWSDYL